MLFSIIHIQTGSSIAVFQASDNIKTRVGATTVEVSTDYVAMVSHE
jgi:hypothetical protein